MKNNNLISPEEAEKLGFSIKKEDITYQEGEFKEPTNIGKAYKIFFLGKDNKLYPPVIPNINCKDTPISIWLPCSCQEIIGYTKKEQEEEVWDFISR